MLSYVGFLLESNKIECPYYYSERLRDFLYNISKSKKPGFEVAKFLLSAEDSNQVSDDISFIDMTDTNDKVSFIQVNRVKRAYDLSKKEVEDGILEVERYQWYLML